MVDSTFSDPNHRLLDNRFDDVEMSRQYDDESTLVNSFRRVLTKKRVTIICSVVFSLLVVIGVTVTGILVSRAKNVVSFKSSLENHVKSDFKSIDPELMASYVDELTSLYEDRQISSDHVLEFEVMLNFDQFNKDHNRVHASHNERKDRFLTFRTKFLKVKIHQGHETYSREINSFADMTEEEFNKLFPPIKVPESKSTTSHVDRLMARMVSDETYLKNLKKALNTDKDVDPKNITGEGLDWRKADGVSKIKNQGLECGSCWAFASVSSVESLYKIYRNVTLDLSEQELVDCETSSKGCEGGFGDTALKYIQNKGVSTDSEIPYLGKKNNCLVKSIDKTYINYFTIAYGQDVLKKSLVISPTIVYIAASNDLSMYQAGVYNGECGSALNHAVLLVGEGYDEVLDKRYWVIKNSWGPDWGEDGYLRLERTNKGEDKCGILSVGITPGF
ncbi:Papain family cysteine protease family protein [Theileria parva strain Muguga]|uniref:Papain family cysteine protease family protein n=1 Tax=Theileria parva strain Muguga TaxID=333668 RepID=UPI001C61FB18|nr:Papain family cysteine protease family protein [Theileria parva strain Muguga]EAN31015.2 Papain family cysteine protease family protein [Theileria parva strain Muguga]